jgi:hypothetical protein
VYKQEAAEEFHKARTKAMWSSIRDRFIGKDARLVNFNEISKRLNLKHSVYLGSQNVPLDHIIGSVGRYQDFTRTFLPKSDDMRGRWSAVAAQQLDPNSSGLPPVALYKVGEWYFVSDGNHRISVARQLGFNDIEAYVCEYPKPPIPITPDTDIDEALLKWERHDFLEKTSLDTLRPDHDFVLTVPGGYHYALAQIAHYQQVLSNIDGEPIPYADAVTGWYDMVYEPIRQNLVEMDVMSDFPNRTIADFFIWVTEYRQELEKVYHERVRITEAVRQFREDRVGLLQRLWNLLRGR